MVPCTDPVALTADLVRCPSVTPAEGGALVLLERHLAQAGFACTRVDRGGVCNLFAIWGQPGGQPGNGPVFGFAGHTDVVPVGNPDDWAYDPFGAVIRDGILYGRGACDMKSGVAAFVAAAIDMVGTTPPEGAIALLITGDEEGAAQDGTIALLDWMRDNGQRIDHCLVGEPTCPAVMGEMFKIGRRGSMSAHITATGVQGHSAYPHRARNPVAALARLVDRLASHQLDSGTTHFDPSTLAVTTFDTGNPASNVIPAACHATVNIRFNDAHTSASISDWLRAQAELVSADTGVIGLDVRVQVSGESFVTEPGPFCDLVAGAVEQVTGTRPVASTSGGTSDARFIKDLCPVVEFGLVGQTMHQVDECVAVDQIVQLRDIYLTILRGYFASATRGSTP